MFYCIRFLIFFNVYRFNNEHGYQIFQAIMNTASIFVGVLVFCFVDAIKIPLRFKTIVLVVFSLSYAYWAYQETLHAITETYFVDINLWNKYLFKLELLGLIASSIRIITIFIWKQTFYSIFKPSRSGLIQEAVQIVWR